MSVVVVESRSVFVFGSNLAGRHGAGGALAAVRCRGAVYGRAEGRQGRSYAIPTKNATLGALPLDAVRWHVTRFITYAAAHPDERFQVTRVGCGLAGYTDAQIAPMFALAPPNCDLPDPPDAPFRWRPARSPSPSVVCAAVQIENEIHSLPRPARHHHIVHDLHDRGIPQEEHHEQGFLLSNGSFADRVTAARLAVVAGQTDAPKWPPSLYSEDLW